MFKTCTNCNIHLPLDNYHILSIGKYNRHPVCKSCRKLKYLNKKNNTTIKTNDELLDELTCNLCGILKPVSEFYKNNANSSKCQNFCKVCNKKKIVDSMSKIDNFIKIILKKFTNKNKNKKINLDIEIIKTLLTEQEGLCAITGHKMTNIVDIKQRTDNIWNIAIMAKNNDFDLIDKDNILLVCNLVYSTKKMYKLDQNQLQNLYRNIINQ